MDKYSINVLERQEKTPNQLRREGQVPATIYGPEFKSQNVQFCAQEFSRLPAGAYSHLVDLNYDDGKKESVIIKKVQRKNTTGQVLNVEFYKVSLDRKLNVTVPIKFKGIAPAVAAGAQLMEVSLSADVECLPKDIPDYLEADLTALLQADDIIHFKDLKFDAETIKVLNPDDGVVAKAVAPRVVVDEAPAAAASGEEGAAEGEAATGEGGSEDAKEEAPSN